MPIKLLPLAFALGLIQAERAFSADKPLAQNAALQYWEAIAYLPAPKGSGDRLTQEEQKRVDEWETAPLDEITRSALKKYSYTLQYMHRGAAMPNCAWASQINLFRDGIGTFFPQGARSSDLRHVTLLRARYRFVNNQVDRAVDDLVALVRFARHLEGGSPLLGFLIALAIERDATQVLADNFWAFANDVQTIASARQKWLKIPPARPLNIALREERDGFIGMLRHHAGLDQKNLPDDEHGNAIFLPTLRYLLGWETRAQALAVVCQTYGKHYERFIRATDVSPDKVQAAAKTFLDSWERDTAGDDLLAVRITRTLFPDFVKLRHKEAETQTRRIMLQTAFAIALEGADKLKSQENLDPLTRQPFESSKAESSYELKSSLGKLIDGPVTLLIRTQPKSK